MAAAYSAVAVPCALLGLAAGAAVDILQRRRSPGKSKLTQASLATTDVETGSTVSPTLLESFVTETAEASVAPADATRADMPDAAGPCRPLPYELPSAQKPLPYELPDAPCVERAPLSSLPKSLHSPYEIPDAQHPMPYELAPPEEPRAGARPMPYAAPETAPQPAAPARQRSVRKEEPASVAHSDLALGLARKIRLAKQPLNPELAKSVAQSDLAVDLASKLRKGVEEEPRGAAATAVCKERIETTAHHKSYVATVRAALEPAA